MKRIDRLWIGFIVGLCSPPLMFVIYFSLRDPLLSISEQISRQSEAKVITHYLSLNALVNLLVFFVFLRMNAERAARGVLFATMMYLLLLFF